MRRFCLFLIVLLYCIGIHAQSHKFLFIGNSYIYTNNLPQMVQQIFSSAGTPFEMQVSAPGGYTFQQHCSYSLAAIQDGGFDYVILQEQSQLPSFPEWQFMLQSYPYAQQLCETVRQYNPSAHIAFYMTWGRKDGDAQNCSFYPPVCTYEGMDSLLYERYMMMARDNYACVSPVGAVWHYVRDHYPEIELYQSDGSHPSYIGTYIAACCFYSLISSQNPLDITWNGSLDYQTANKAKNAVTTVLYDSLSKWCFESSADTIDYIASFSSDASVSVYPNPAQNFISVSAPYDIQIKSYEIYDMGGRMLSSRFVSDPVMIDVSFLEPGIYVMVFSDGKRHYRTKFTIVR